MFISKYSYIIFITLLFLGLYNYSFAILAIICMITPILYALVGRGRYWCGHICPRGSFFEQVVSKTSATNKFPSILRSFLFRLIVLICMFTVFGMGLYENWGDLRGIGYVFYKIIVITTLLGMILALLFNNRSWCMICPMGSIACVITKVKGTYNRLPLYRNTKSDKQIKRCPMDIKASYNNKGIITNGDCLRCHECVYSSYISRRKLND